MTDVVALVSDFIALKVSGLAVSTNLFDGPNRDSEEIPADSVFVAPVGGPPALRTMGETNELRTSILNVFVRSSQWSVGNALAQELIDAFNGVTAVPVGMLDAFPLQGQPLHNGIDLKARNLFTVSIQTVHEEAT